MQQDKDLSSLDNLVAGLQGSDSRGLLLEHLRAARCGLLGAMHGEYLMSLTQAMDSLACISDKGSRAETKQLLQGLIDSPAV